MMKNVNLMSKENARNQMKDEGLFSYYIMTIPILSKDNQKAYVELNLYCGSLCGAGMSIYLQKLNGKWTIIHPRDTWIS